MLDVNRRGCCELGSRVLVSRRLVHVRCAYLALRLVQLPSYAVNGVCGVTIHFQDMSAHNSAIQCGLSTNTSISQRAVLQ